MYGLPSITYSTSLTATEIGQWCNQQRLAAFSQAKEMLTASPEFKAACGYRQFTREETVCEIIRRGAAEIERSLAKWEKANPGG